MTDSFFDAVLRNTAPEEERRLPWHDDPVAFATEAVAWPKGERLAPYQAEVLRAIVEDRRVAVRSLRGAGKSTTAALAILWLAVTRDAVCDWKCLTTAGSWRQLEKFLWVEVATWARRLRFDVIGRAPFDKKQLFTTMLRLDRGQAFGAASDDPRLLEGLHSPSTLVVIDESKAVSASVFDSIEGSLSGHGESFVLAISTPGPPTGRFWEICTKKPGLGDWRTIKVGLEEAIAAGRVSREWAEQRRLQWGASSAPFLNHVLGEFAASDEDGVVPYPWVELAIERWQKWNDDGRPSDEDTGVVVGVDVGRGGDKSVLAVRRGDMVQTIERHTVADVMAVTGHVVAKLGDGGTAVVDSIGIGAGAVDRLREQGHNVIPFNAAAKTNAKDKSGEMSFLNLRSEAWWRLRESLDPANNPTLCLPPDDELVGDLTAPRWRMNSSGKVQIESKDEIRKRLGRSPDAGDAVVMSLGPSARLRGRRMLAYPDRGFITQRMRPANSSVGYRNDPLIAR